MQRQLKLAILGLCLFLLPGCNNPLDATIKALQDLIAVVFVDWRGPDNIPVGTCSPMTAKFSGATNAEIQKVGQYKIIFSAPPDLMIYSDRDCKTPITEMTTNSLEPTAFVRATKAGAYVLSAFFATFQVQSARRITFTPLPPSRLDVVYPLSTPINTCQDLDIYAKDRFGNLSIVSAIADLTVGLATSAANTLVYFSDALCKIPTTVATITKNQTAVKVYGFGKQVGNATITASATGLSPGTLSVAIVSGQAARLALTFPAGPYTVNSCTSFTVSATKPDGSDYVVTTNNLPLSFGTNKVYRPGCTTEETSPNIAIGSSSTTLSFLAPNSPQTLSFTVNSTGFVSDTENLNIVGKAPAKLAVTYDSTGSGAAVRLACTVVQISVLGDDNAAAYLGADFTTTIVPSSPPSATNLTQTSIYRGALCGGTPVSTVVIPKCNGTQCAAAELFSFKAGEVGNLRLTGTGPAVTSATKDFLIVPNLAQPFKTRLTKSANTLMAGRCLKLTLTTLNNSDEEVYPSEEGTVNLVTSQGAPNAAHFYSKDDCSGTAVTSVSFPINKRTITFSYNETIAGIDSLQANLVSTNSNAFNIPAATTITYIPGPVAQVGFQTLPTIFDGVCSNPVKFFQADEFGNRTNENLTLRFTPGGGGPGGPGLPPPTTLSVSLKSDCTDPISEYSYNTNSGSLENINFYFLGTPQGFVLLTVVLVETGFALNQQIQVFPFNNTTFAFSADGTSFGKDECFPLDVSVVDGNNAPILDPNVIATISHSPGGATISTDQFCTTPLANNTLEFTGGTNQIRVYIQDPSAGSNKLTVMAANASSSSFFYQIYVKTLNITDGPTEGLPSACVGPFTLTYEPQFVQPPQGLVDFSVSTFSTGGGPATPIGTTVRFSTDSDCLNNGVTMNGPTATFYIRFLEPVPIGTPILITLAAKGIPAFFTGTTRQVTLLQP